MLGSQQVVSKQAITVTFGNSMQKVLPCAVVHGLSGLQRADGSDSLQSLKSLGRARPIVSALGISQTVRDNMLPNTPLFDLPGSNCRHQSCRGFNGVKPKGIFKEPIAKSAGL